MINAMKKVVLLLRCGFFGYGSIYVKLVYSNKSTCFLMGPFNQFKKMFAPTRVVATVLVFIAIVMTLFAALHLKNPGLALMFIIIQSLAMTWYSLSYIPYARDAVRKTLESCIT
ncbi:vesicle transport protein SFT2B isoform X3 [Bombus impatiens]|uniref:Vesicle transport protein n=1 Tax=Bombus impatiens TaxID=132113 RepID=A0A6P6FK22_BOMIM|nr:vesicle transport protein SFT2B isoform X3 [Bombus impatiens]XP_050486114.1 vesicle transport protein SFT2B isoform X3 [Bombus huntii]